MNQIFSEYQICKVFGYILATYLAHRMLPDFVASADVAVRHFWLTFQIILLDESLLIYVY